MSNTNGYLSEHFISIVWPAFSSTLKRKKTQVSYFGFMRNLCEYTKCDFFDVTPKQAQAYFDMKATKEDGPGIKTMHTMLSAFRSVANYIQQHEELGFPGYTSPFTEVSLSMYSDTLYSSDIISTTELDQIMEAASGDPLIYLAIALAFRCCLSPSEICGLRKSHIRQYEDGSGLISVIHAEKEIRYVKVPMDVMVLICDQFTGSLDDEDDDQFLFLNKYGKPMNLRTLQMRVRDMMMAADIVKKYTLQDIRNASIAYMLDGGATPSDISSYTGIVPRWINRFAKNAVPATAPCDYNRIAILPLKTNTEV